MTGMRNRCASAVTDSDLDRAAIHSPGDLKAFSGERIRVQDGIAEKLADDERRVAHRVIENSDRAELIGKRPAREGDTGRRTRQVDDSRRPHLLSHPPGTATHYLAHRGFRCPDWRQRKPVKPQELITTSWRLPARERVVAALFQASKALRLWDDQLTCVLRYGIVIRSRVPGRRLSRRDAGGSGGRVPPPLQAP